MSASFRAIELVKIIGNPTNAAQVHSASEELQAIQHSNYGWAVANAMLEEDDDNVRFYGALTLQIKINKEGSHQSEDDTTELRSHLLTWLVKLASLPARNFVLYKLCAALATYFTQAPMRWLSAVRQIICSLRAGSVVTGDQLKTYPDSAQVFMELTPVQQRVTIRFCQTLAEDMSNSAGLSQQSLRLDDTFSANTPDVTSILAVCINNLARDNVDLGIEALNCLNAWIIYAHSNWSRDIGTLQLLQDLTPITAEFLVSNNDDLRDLAIEIFVSNLEFRLKFFKKEHVEIISTLVRQKIGPECLVACRSGQQEPEIVSLGKLVAAYGKITVKDLVVVRKHASSESIVALFLELLTAPGYPAEDDEMIFSATEFWNEYAEHAVYAAADSEVHTLSKWLPQAREDLMKALQLYLPKMSHPPPEISKTWDEETFQQWKFFRDNVMDYLEFITEIPDSNLLHYLIEVALQILPTRQWFQLEGVLFCINAIADSVRPANDDPAMNALMGSSIFSNASDMSLDVPALLRRAVLRMIDNYSTFIKSNPQYIPPVLTFLFTILEATPPDQVRVADQAAKSLESLCSSCRRSLTQHLGELLAQVPQALSGPSANGYQKEKVMAAVASIIQSLPSEELKAEPISILIQVIETDLNAAVQAMQRGDVEQGELIGTTALQCLASIGKGIQALDDRPIDIDSNDDDETSTTEGAHSQTFWTLEAGAAIQQRILACFEIISYLQNAGDAIDAACDVLRAGLAETEPGPFVFPPSTTVAFVAKATTSLDTPRIEAVLSTACTFVSAHSRRNTPHLFDEVLAVYQSVARVMGLLKDPSNDPQLAQICVEFLQRLLVAYLDVLLAPSDEEIAGVLQFVLACVTGQAPMLKRIACNFFEPLIAHGRPNNPAPLPVTRVPVGVIVQHFAPLIATSLLYQISGVAQRSELDSLSKPLRAFVFSVPNCKKYLEHALLEQETTFVELAAANKTVDQSERKVFIAKIVGLRGGRQTNIIVREFWARCKGTVSKFE
ncbi:hypothetical protein AAFC00_007184 [Neodothiora populina]|uniref:Exportin-1/Importin-beta-like domain-containing protein n=1 Tax=Neodothiora populina TaxID=2781224 RepID=A0ABR3PHG5_9PEZI